MSQGEECGSVYGGGGGCLQDENGEEVGALERFAGAVPLDSRMIASNSLICTYLCAQYLSFQSFAHFRPVAHPNCPLLLASFHPNNLRLLVVVYGVGAWLHLSVAFCCKQLCQQCSRHELRSRLLLDDGTF